MSGNFATSLIEGFFDLLDNRWQLHIYKNNPNPDFDLDEASEIETGTREDMIRRRNLLNKNRQENGIKFFILSRYDGDQWVEVMTD